MFDGNGNDNRFGSIAFLDGSASAESGPGAIESRRRRSEAPRGIALMSPAAAVMTDFTWDTPVTVEPDRFIDDALRDMIVAGVRALLVMQGEVVVGLITSYDIQGERPLQFLDASGFSRHSDIEVRHIMTPWNAVATVDLPWVSSAAVKDVIERFRRKGDSHLVVVEYAEQGDAFVRGLFSRSELERLLGQSA
jgi:DeoR family transcriptional regulator, catabolite repression regulator